MNKKLPVSVVISAFNEEKKLPACLESVKWAEEIIVVNNQSTDKTADIAKKHGAKVFVQPNNLMLNVNKNFGFTKATQPWILCLDADERVSPELSEEIDSRFRGNDGNVAGFWIPRKNIIFGKWIQNSIWWPDYQLRLFRKGKGKFPEKHVHEMLVVDGESVKLQQPMVHFNYDSVSQFLYKMDKIYTENEMTNILSSGKQLTWVDALRFPSEDFLRTFFLQKGYKDGLHGLVLSLLQAFYAELVFVKVWEKQGFKEYNSGTFIKDVSKEMRKIAYEFYYWILTVSIQETKSAAKKIVFRLKRKRLSV